MSLAISLRIVLNFTTSCLLPPSRGISSTCRMRTFSFAFYVHRTILNAKGVEKVICWAYIYMREVCTRPQHTLTHVGVILKMV